VRLEPNHEAVSNSSAPLSPLLQREAIARGHAWLSRFAPLLDEPAGLSAEEVRLRLEEVPGLRREGTTALSDLDTHSGAGEAELRDTLRQALDELEAREGELRRRLGRLAPGDPEAVVDLGRLREKLAEAAARREVESVTGTTPVEETLELQTSPGNLGAAAMNWIMGVGVFAFTSVHALFLIGGFMRAFGPIALALLAFYAIFWTAAAAIIGSGIRLATREQIRLDGRELTIHRVLGPWTAERRMTLASDARAHVTTTATRQQNTVSTEIAVQGADGSDVRIAYGRPAVEQERAVERINMHLAALPR
jgi:hypothetical protein